MEMDWQEEDYVLLELEPILSSLQLSLDDSCDGSDDVIFEPHPPPEDHLGVNQGQQEGVQDRRDGAGRGRSCPPPVIYIRRNQAVPNVLVTVMGLSPEERVGAIPPLELNVNQPLPYFEYILASLAASGEGRNGVGLQGQRSEDVPESSQGYGYVDHDLRLSPALQIKPIHLVRAAEGAQAAVIEASSQALPAGAQRSTKKKRKRRPSKLRCRYLRSLDYPVGKGPNEGGFKCSRYFLRLRKTV